MLSVIEGLSYRKIREFREVWRRDEGVPPYRSGVTPAKSLAYTNKILTGGRGTPLPCSTESKYGHRLLARRGTLQSPNCY